MLDPELRVDARDEGFDGRAGRGGLFPAEFGGRNLPERALFRIVIEVSTQHDRPGLLEIEEQHLVPWRVPRRRLDDDAAIAEHVVIRGRDERGLAVPQRAEILRLRSR